MHLITFLILYPFIKIISILPFRLVYILSDFLYVIIYKLLKYRVKLVSNNIKLAFPEFSSSKRLSIESDFYRHFCDIMLESIKASSMTRKQFSNRYKLINGDLVFDLLKKIFEKHNLKVNITERLKCRETQGGLEERNTKPLITQQKSLTP